MRKTLLVLTLILLFLLTQCSADPPRSAGSDSESTILIVSPTEDETVSDPTEQTKETEENHDTKPSLPQTNEDSLECKQSESMQYSAADTENGESHLIRVLYVKNLYWRCTE